MPVKIKLMGDLGRFADSETVEIEGGDSTLGAVLDEVTQRYPALGSQLFDDQGRLRYTTLLVLGGRSLAWPGDRGEPINEGAELLVMRFMAGG